MILWSLVIVATVSCFINGHPLLDDEWMSYKKQYSKQYSITEDTTRRIIWEENIKYIQKHNEEERRGLHSFTLGINSFSDMSQDEMNRNMKGLKVSDRKVTGKLFKPEVSTDDLPTTMNWTAQGYVTEVGNQGQCGSCWAFSVLGALEGQWRRVKGKLVRLSVQDLMDCSTKIGNNGCEGGFLDKTYRYIKDTNGVDTWVSYPYEAKDGKCRHRNDTIGATDNGYVNIKKGSEKDLFRAIATIGPVAVAMDGEHASFSMYKKGIYDEPQCSSSRIDHTLLIVGYGTQDGKDYWLAKNSWGTSWGMDGYIMMSRNKNNQCAVATLASYPIVHS